MIGLLKKLFGAKPAEQTAEAPYKAEAVSAPAVETAPMPVGIEAVVAAPALIVDTADIAIAQLPDPRAEVAPAVEAKKAPAKKSAPKKPPTAKKPATAKTKAKPAV